MLLTYAIITDRTRPAFPDKPHMIIDLDLADKPPHIHGEVKLIPFISFPIPADQKPQPAQNSIRTKVKRYIYSDMVRFGFLFLVPAAKTIDVRTFAAHSQTTVAFQSAA